MYRILLWVLGMHLSITSLATSYYLSNSGNDSHSGTSPTEAWKTISRLNSHLSLLTAGDQVLFRCGDQFNGSIQVPSGITGEENAPLVFGQYGSGPKPIISGSISITNWVQQSSTIWKANVVADTVWQVFANHQRLFCARSPNQGYFRMDNSNGNAGFFDDALAKPINFWKNTSLLLHLNEFWWEDAIIDSSSVDGYIQFSYGSSGYNTLIPGSGYFIQNKFELLDTLNEWFYDKSSQSLYIVSSENPSSKNITASIYATGLTTQWPWVSHDIRIQDLEFQEQGQDGVQIRGSKGLIVTRCRFFRAGQHALLMSSNYSSISKHNEIVENEMVENLANGIYTFNVGSSLISKNRIRKSGLYPSPGGAGEATGQSGMRLWFGDSLTVSYNKIDSSGNCGINLESSYSLVEKNLIEHSMLLLSDGAALYNNMGDHNRYQYNILRYTKGDMSASAPAQARYTKELYLDIAGETFSRFEHNTLVSDENNTAIGLTPNSQNLIIRNNVVYKCSRGLEIFNYDPFNQPVKNIEVLQNTFFMNRQNAHPYYMNAWNGLTSMFSICDSNYLCNPYSNQIVEHFNGAGTNFLNYTQWKTASLSDNHSKLCQFQWTYPEDSSFIITNTHDSTMLFNFSSPVTTLDNTTISTLILPPYTSRIVLGTASVTSESLVTSQMPELKLHFSLYPNPTSGRVTIQLLQASALPEQLDILDNTGKIIQKQVIHKDLSEVQFPEIPGIYFLKIRNQTERVIVK